MEIHAGTSRKGCVFTECRKLTLKADDDRDVALLTWMFAALRSGFMEELSRDWDPKTKCKVEEASKLMSGSHG